MQRLNEMHRAINLLTTDSVRPRALPGGPLLRSMDWSEKELQIYARLSTTDLTRLSSGLTAGQWHPAEFELHATKSLGNFFSRYILMCLLSKNCRDER